MMKDFNTPLKQVDPEIYRLIEGEKDRLNTGLIMIPSESMASRAVLEANGSVLNSKYAEGYPGKRYYTGFEYVDDIEKLAIERAKKLFGAEHANVQPHSGSSANVQVYHALLRPGDTVLGLSLAHGGHLTHGHPINFTGRTYRFVQYEVERDTQQLDMDKIHAIARKEKPKMIVSGTTAYSRILDFKRFHEIAEDVGAYSMADVSHIAGLIAGGAHPSPLPFTDVVTTTTHKTLCGPRSAIILSKKIDRIADVSGLDEKKAAAERNLAAKIDRAVFPGLQGGPLEHTIAAKAVCFRNAMKPEFAAFAHQTVKNAKALAETLMDNGLSLVAGGTDTHLLLIDLTPQGVGLGFDVSEALARAGIYTNRNMIPFDPSTAFKPSGVRLGTPVLTQRGMKESEMKVVGDWISAIAKDSANAELIDKTRSEVTEFLKDFPLYDF
jgi:glycine hydroxymethyltransferase